MAGSPTCETSYADYHELLADPGVDAVEILTPHHLHESVILDALARGKRVSAQKPMTVSLARPRPAGGRTARGEVFGL